MINIRHTVSALALSSVLVFGACGKKDKGDGVSLPEIGSLSVKSADAGTIENLLKVSDRKVGDAEAEQALKGLGFEDDVSWASKKGKAGDYHYTDLTFKNDDDKDVAIADVKLDGVHMQGDEPTFDKMTLSGVTLSDDDTKGSIDRLILSQPHPALAAKILNGLSQIDSLDDLDMDIDIKDGEFSFGAMLMQGVDLKSDDGLMRVDTLGWGQDDTSGKGAFVAKNISFTGMDDKNGMPVTMSLKSASARDVDAKMMQQMKGKGSKGMSPLSPMSGNFNIEDFKLSADTFTVSLEGITAKTTTKGNVTTEQQVLRPLRVSFSGKPSDPQMAQAQKAFADMGFENMEFTGKATKILNAKTDKMTVKDANFALKDGFNLAYDLKASGFGAMADATDADMSDVMDNMTIEQMNVRFTDYSFVDKAIKLAAKMQGSNAALMRMQAKGGLMLLPAMGENPAQKELLSQVATAAGKFIDDGGTLVIGMNPATPMSITKLQGMGQRPDQAMDQLGLTISHQK